MNSKSLLWLVAAAAVGTFFFVRGGSVDHDGYQSALAAAAATNKLVLVDFTGSDWCGWCIKLDEETFSKPEFREFAANHLEFLVVDFPKNKSLREGEREQNQNLKTKFGVEGFPTLILLDASGKEIARQRGYLPGGPEALIRWINQASGQ